MELSALKTRVASGGNEEVREEGDILPNPSRPTDPEITEALQGHESLGDALWEGERSSPPSTNVTVTGQGRGGAAGHRLGDTTTAEIEVITEEEIPGDVEGEAPLIGTAAPRVDLADKGTDSAPAAEKATHPPNPRSVRGWSSLFGEKTRVEEPRKLDFFQPSIRDGKVVVKCPADEVEANVLKWRNTLVGYVLGRKPYFKHIEAFVRRLWKPKSALEIFSRENGFFFFRFGDQEDASRVLEGGPYFFGGRLMVLRDWTADLDMHKELLSSVPIWVRFPNLKPLLWSQRLLSRMASAVGKPLFMDLATSQGSRLGYARVCVETKIGETIPREIIVELDDGRTFEQEVVAEWVPPACTICHAFGHLEKSCSFGGAKEGGSTRDQLKAAREENQTPKESGKDNFQWVQRRERGKKRANTKPSSKPLSKDRSNRFKALTTLTSNEEDEGIETTKTLQSQETHSQFGGNEIIPVAMVANNAEITVPSANEEDEGIETTKTLQSQETHSQLGGNEIIPVAVVANNAEITVPSANEEDEGIETTKTLQSQETHSQHEGNEIIPVAVVANNAEITVPSVELVNLAIVEVDECTRDVEGLDPPSAATSTPSVLVADKDSLGQVASVGRSETDLSSSWDIDDEYEKFIRRMNPPRVVFNNEACVNATVIQFDSANKHGILLEVVQALTDLNLNIKKAYISSDGGWSMDVFNVTDRDRKKLQDESIMGIMDYIRKSFVPSLRRSVGASDYTSIELTGTDRPGLLSEVSAVLTDLYCNVVNAELWTHNTRAAAVMHVTDVYTGLAITDQERLSRIKVLLCNVLKGSNKTQGAKTAVSLGVTHIERRLHQMMFDDRDYERSDQDPTYEKLRPIVTVDNWYDKDYSVVTIRCKDRLKLLFDTVCTLTDMQYVVFHANIDAEGPEAYLEYCIKHVDGSPVKSEAERQRVIQCLKAAIERRVSEGLIFELCTSDRVGLLSDVTRIFRENSLSVTRAVVTTRGGKAINTFYVRDAAGNPVDTKTIEAVQQMIGPTILQVY